MKKTSFCILAIALLTFSAFKVVTNWNVVPEGTIVSFELPDEGTKGTIGGLKANISFDPKDPGGASIIVATVDLSTFNSGNDKKDNHLKSADFFDITKFPVATFKCSSVSWDPRSTAPDKGAAQNSYLALGTLTIKDSTKAVEIPFTFDQNEGGGTFKGSFTIFSSDYGIMKKSKSGKDKVVVTINVPVKK